MSLLSLHVCYVTMAFPTPYETFAAGDIRALAREGVRVTVHSLRPPHPEGAALMRPWGIDRVAVSHHSIASIGRGAFYALRHPLRAATLTAWLVRSLWRTPQFLARALVLVPRCLEILAEIERTRPDAVHLFWGHYPAAVGFLVQRYCPRTPLTMFLGAYDLEWNLGVSAPVAREARAVWTHARTNSPAIEALGVDRDRIRVAHRGIELGQFEKRPTSKIPARIMTAGRLHPDKGMGYVIEAFAAIAKRRPGATLVVAGDGPDRERLHALASELGVAGRVSFLGRVPHETVLDEMARAELFLYMSVDHTDRLPNVVKEAVASRCLCIVSRTTGIDELIRDGIDGWVVERGDVAGAVARISQALEDPSCRASMIASANENLRNEFDIDRSMARYVDCWNELLRREHDTPREVPANAFLESADRDTESAARR